MFCAVDFSADNLLETWSQTCFQIATREIMMEFGLNRLTHTAGPKRRNFVMRMGTKVQQYYDCTFRFTVSPTDQF